MANGKPVVELGTLMVVFSVERLVIRLNLRKRDLRVFAPPKKSHAKDKQRHTKHYDILIMFD
jgi:hypothetical protein